MSRIVLLVEHAENRRLLAEWLSLHHEVIIVDDAEELRSEFDLGIVDRSALDHHCRAIDAKKRAVRPLFLPFLLVTPRPGISGGKVWETIDELIVSPVEKLELAVRVEVLLRVRSLSLENASLARRLERELARAHHIQSELLPQEPPPLPGFELAAQCIPANEVGGDFFDWEATDGTAVLTVGDVMGKGIPAALLASTVRTVLRALARQNEPSAALDLLRETLRQDLERTSTFVTLFHARVAAGHVRYVDAGHGHARVRRRTGTIERLERGGRPVGFPGAAPYRECSVALAPGDMLFVYSDGLIDGSGSPAEELFAPLEPSTPASALVAALAKSAAGGTTRDDVTILLLKATADTG